MATIHVFAEQLDLSIFERLEAQQRPHGRTAREVLDEADEHDCVYVGITPPVQRQLQTLATATGDAALQREADTVSRAVPVGHLRALPPETLVLVGWRVAFSEAESRLLRQ